MNNPQEHQTQAQGQHLKGTTPVSSEDNRHWKYFYVVVVGWLIVCIVLMTFFTYYFG